MSKKPTTIRRLKRLLPPLGAACLVLVATAAPLSAQRSESKTSGTRSSASSKVSRAQQSARSATRSSSQPSSPPRASRPSSPRGQDVRSTPRPSSGSRPTPRVAPGASPSDRLPDRRGPWNESDVRTYGERPATPPPSTSSGGGWVRPDRRGDRGHGGHRGSHRHSYNFGFGFGYYPYVYSPYYYRPYSYFGFGYYPFYSYYGDPYYGYGYYGGGGGYYPRGRTAYVQGAVDLNVKPKDTAVYLDGYYVGVTGDYDGWPRFLWLEDGVHELIFYKEGYRTVARELSVRPDVVLNVKFRMEPGVPTPVEELTAYREDRGRDAPTGRPFVERGNYVEREPEGYAAPPAPSAPPPKGPGTIDLRGDAARLLLAVSPAEASVYLDGRFIGIASELGSLGSGLLLDPGEHRIQVFHPRYDSQERTFTVEAGKETRVELDLEG